MPKRTWTSSSSTTRAATPCLRAKTCWKPYWVKETTARLTKRASISTIVLMKRKSMLSRSTRLSHYRSWSKTLRPSSRMTSLWVSKYLFNIWSFKRHMKLSIHLRYLKNLKRKKFPNHQCLLTRLSPSPQDTKRIQMRLKAVYRTWPSCVSRDRLNLISTKRVKRLAAHLRKTPSPVLVSNETSLK